MTERNQTVIDTFLKSFSNKNQSVEDLQEFENRVLSYVEQQKWVSFPLTVSPTICAQYGWKCIDSNLLECVSCCAKLCTQVPRVEIYDAYMACIKKIHTDLRECHKTHCPWHLAPSPESFVKMLPMPKEEALNKFVQRFKPCLQFECSIPQVKNTVPSLLGLDRQHVTSLCELAETNTEDVHLFGMSVVCIAATGWTLLSKKNGDVKVYIKCDNCQRSIWVKSFTLINTLGTDDACIGDNETTSPIASVKEEKDFDTDSPRKRIKLDKIDFDPIEEHRPWCLWVASSNGRRKLTSKEDEEKEEKEALVPGWKIYLKSLLRNVSDPQVVKSDSNPSTEHLRNVRDLLESCTSPIKT